MINAIRENVSTHEIELDITVSQDCKVTLSAAVGDDLKTDFVPAVFYKKGNHTVIWNKKDFLNNPMPAGEYDFVMLENDVQVSWKGAGIGNSKLVDPNNNYYGNQDFALDVAIAGGYIYFATDSGESGKNLVRAPLSDVQTCQMLNPVVPKRGGTARRVAESSNRVYIVCYVGAYEFVYAVTVDAASTEVVFPAGETSDVDGFFSSHFNSVIGKKAVTGYTYSDSTLR